MRITSVLLIILFVILFGLVIFGILYQPKKDRINIASGSGHFNKQCSTEKVTCNTSRDCADKCVEAHEGEEYECMALPNIDNLTAVQKQLMSVRGDNVQPTKYCLPAKAKMECNIATGGIPVWAGWSDPTRMEFDCMCSYPLWASSRTCDPETGLCKETCELNSGVCEGGTLNWDLTKKSEPPSAHLCECPDGKIRVTDYSSGIPRCVPKENVSFYHDMDREGQGRGTIDLQSIKAMRLVKTIDQQDCGGMKKCHEGGCCPDPNGECCGRVDGKSVCCLEGYKCDRKNKLCILEDDKCEENETKCEQGCCPIQDAICCGNGINCCPQNYPHCDMENGTCNPDMTSGDMDGTCIYGGQQQCDGFCCNIKGDPNATCCGAFNDEDGNMRGFCCPSEYPLCDMANKMCKPLEG